MGIMDGIIDIVFVLYLILLLVGLFKFNGKFVLFGVMEKLFDLYVFFLILGMYMILISRELYLYVYLVFRILNKIML